MTQPATNNSERLARVLVRRNLLTQESADALLANARKLHAWLGFVAVSEGALSHVQIAEALAQEFNLPFVDLNMEAPNQRALAMLPVDLCRRHSVLPVGLYRDSVIVAVADPLDDMARTAVREFVPTLVSWQVAPLDILCEKVEAWYGAASSKPAVVEAPIAANQESTAAQTSLLTLLNVLLEENGSDLHLRAGSPPVIRVYGRLQPLPLPSLTGDGVREMIISVLNQTQIAMLDDRGDLDFAYSLPGVSRFRVNAHRQRGTVAAVFRAIPEAMPTLTGLGMPDVLRHLTLRPRGLVLVTGPTGSGKTTTLAAMIDEINRTRQVHVVTIEDPIEFVHKDIQSVITQREVGSDTETFASALRYVLRQDPDVILIGEMRDLETISAALTAAETGHLVLATLHTSSAGQSIDRIIDVFPTHQQTQVRYQMANLLEGVIAQALLPHSDGKGLYCVQEIMVATSAIRNLIREAKTYQVPSILQAGSKQGMQTLDQALQKAVAAGMVSQEDALAISSNPDDFERLPTEV